MRLASKRSWQQWHIAVELTIGDCAAVQRARGCKALAHAADAAVADAAADGAGPFCGRGGDSGWSALQNISTVLLGHLEAKSVVLLT